MAIAACKSAPNRDPSAITSRHLRERLIKNEAKVSSYKRYVTFQTTDVAVLRRSSGMPGVGLLHRVKATACGLYYRQLVRFVAHVGGSF